METEARSPLLTRAGAGGSAKITPDVGPSFFTRNPERNRLGQNPVKGGLGVYGPF
jgi:hypothetical protein